MKNNIVYFFVLLVLVACKSTPTERNAVDPALEKHRETYKQSFLKNPRSPLVEEDLVHLDFFPSNNKFKVKAYFEEDLQPRPFKMPTYSGMEKEFARYGTFFFEIDGQELSLEVYRNLKVVQMPQYRDVLFLPFKDDSNSETSYGGGRYIDMKIGDIQENEAVIDFNLAYNPWCAFSDGYNCPIPPFSNHLDIAVLAGEKKYKGKKKSRPSDE